MNKLQLTHALKILQLNLLLLKGFQEGYCFCNRNKSENCPSHVRLSKNILFNLIIVFRMSINKFS